MARQQTKICPSCKQLFRGRRDAVTCSSRCRKRLYRAKSLLSQEVENLKQIAESAAHTTEHALESIESTISSELSPSIATEQGFVATPATANPAPAPPLLPSIPKQPVAGNSQANSATPITNPLTGAPKPTLESAQPPLAEQPVPAVAFPAKPVSTPASTPVKPPVEENSLENIVTPDPQQIFPQSFYRPTSSVSTPSSLSPPTPVNNIPFTDQIIKPQAVISNSVPSAPAKEPRTTSVTDQNLPVQNSFWKRTIAATVVLVVMMLGVGILAFLGARSPAPKIVNTQQLNQTTAISNVTNTSNLNFNINTTVTGGKKLTATGPVAIQNEADSTHAFSVQNAAGSNLLVADTTNGRVGIGQTPIADGATLQVAGNTETSGTLLASGGSSALSNSGLVINNVLVCTATGCVPQGLVFTGDAATLGGHPSSFYTNSANITSGTLSDSVLSSNVALLNANQTFTGINSFTSAGNTFVGDGSGLTALDADNITSGTLTDSRLSNNVALLNANNTFTGNNTFDGITVQNGSFLFQSATNSVGAFQIQNAAGNDNLLVADTINSRIGIGVAAPNYTLDVNGDVNVSAGHTFRIDGTDVCSSGLCNPSSGSSFYINNTTGLQAAANFNIQSASSNAVGGIIRGANGQTADLFEAQNFGGGNVFAIDPAGNVNIAGQYEINGAPICTSSGCTAAAGSGAYIQNGVALQAAANFNIESTSTSNVVGILKGKSGQTADILQLKDGNGTVVLSVGNQGQTLDKDTSAGSHTFFQIQNSSSASLLTADTITGQILLPNANLSSTALLLANNANLYAPSNNNLKTDNNLTVAGNLTVNGAGLFKNTANSTAALQVQNGAGLALLTADTTNFQVSTTKLQASSTIASTSGTANAQISWGYQATTGLTESGNEITDATRTTNTQGDGRTPPDSSTGIWEATTNLVTNGGFESNTTGWTGFGSGTLVRDTSVSKFGSSSLKASANSNDGIENTGLSATSGTQYTASVWVNVANGSSMVVQWVRANLSTIVAQQTFTGTGTWQRITLTITAPATETEYLYIRGNPFSTATNFWIDGAQVEQKAYATPYVETNGSTASRSAAQVLAPASLLNTTKGWVAMRVRMGMPSSQIGSGDIRPFMWGITGSSNVIGIRYHSGNWTTFRYVTGNVVGEQDITADTFAAGDMRTIVMAWDGSTVKFSLNGSAFTSAGNTAIPTLSSSFGIGNDADGSSGGLQLDSDILWTATGTGALTNNDAANFNNYGNTDPLLSSLTTYGSGAATPTMVWNGVNSNLQGTSGTAQSSLTLDDTSLYRSAANVLTTNNNFQIQSAANSTNAFQVQNASGANILAVDTTNSRVNFAAATSSSTGVFFGAGDELYGVGGSLKTLSSLWATGNANLFQTATNSTTAFQIQNAAGLSLLTGDTTNFQVNTSKVQASSTIASTSGTANAQISWNYQATTGLTESGNEITDATRTTNTQGDGVTPPDSSTGIWEATTNLFKFGGFETSSSGWAVYGPGGSVARDTSKSRFGAASLLVTTGGVNPSSGTTLTGGAVVSISSSTAYTLSFWAYVPVGTSIDGELQEWDASTNVVKTDDSGTIVGNGAWQKVTISTTTTSTTASGDIFITILGNGVKTFNIDGVQIEQKAFATPYVETNGTTASRSAARVQAPASNLNATQGWVAMRIRTGWAIGSGSSTRPGLFQWGNGTTWQNSAELGAFVYAPNGQISFYTPGGDATGGPGSYYSLATNVGDYATLVFAWTSTQLKMSLNGQVFRTATRTTVGAPSSDTTFDIGRQNDSGTQSYMDSDYLWFASGSGTLTDTDAASLNAYGNTDPLLSSLTTYGSGAATPTMVWNGVNSNLQGTSGTRQSSLTLDDTSLYRSAANTLTTNNNFQIQSAANSTNAFQVQNASGNNLLNVDSLNSKLTANTSALFQNAANSTTAFQIQNSAGGSLVNVDSTNSSVTLAGLDSGSLGGWTTSSNPLTNIRGNHTSIIANGYVYVIGGFDGTNAQSTVYYAKLNADGSNGTWQCQGTSGTCGITPTNSNSLPQIRFVHSSVTANGYVYVIGGKGISNAYQSTVYYAKLNADGSTGTWQTSTNTLPVPLGYSSATTANGYVYLMGGNTTGDTPQQTVYYAKLNADGSTSTWTTSANPLLAVRYNASTAVANGYVYVMGGCISGASCTAPNLAATVYYAKLNADGSNGAWNTNTGNPLPQALDYANSVVSNGYVYVIGGFSGSTQVNTVYYAKLNIDGSVGAWSTNTNALPDIRSAFSSVTSNGYVYAIGGSNGGAFQSTIYYASTSRLQVGANLDLIGAQGGDGTAGGSLTANNGTFAGSLNVQGVANFSQSVSAANLSVQSPVGNVLSTNASNLRVNVTNLQATGTITLQNEQGASIQLRTVSNSSAGGAMTFSGNEITDATRSAATQGDGRQPPDSSEGIWEATTNLVSNGGFETTATDIWSTVNSATRTRDTTTAKFGSSSVKVVTGNVTSDEGLATLSGSPVTVSASTAYTLSAWVRGSAAGETLQLQARETGGTNQVTNVPFTTTGAWQRVTAPFTSNSGATTVAIRVDTQTQQLATYWVDGIQLEQKAFATPYVETNGGTATRNAGRAQAPATNLNATTGWAAIRTRVGFSSTAKPSTAPFFTWGDSNQNYYELYLNSSNNFVFSRAKTASGVASAPVVSAGSYPAGAVFTLVVSWSATGLSLSVNGANFGTTADTTHIPTIANTTFDIGNGVSVGDSDSDSDILWSATGTGTLSNGDAAALNAYGNSDPTLANLNSVDGSDAASFAWDGESTQYAGANSTPVNDSQISIDDVSLTHTGNGSVAVQGSVNSATAFQVQNATGTSLLTVDTTNSKVILSGITDIQLTSTTAFQVQTAGGAANIFNVDTSTGGGVITLGTASSTPTLLVLGNKNTSGDPTCTTAGSIYFNSSSSQFRGCDGTNYRGLGSMTELADVVNGSAANITISSIPQTYKSLYIVAYVRSSRSASSDNLFLRFNGDTGNNYNYSAMGYDSAADSFNSGGYVSTLQTGFITGATGGGGTDAYSTVTMTIPNYAGSHLKSVTSQSTAPLINPYVNVTNFGGVWNSTSAINSILFAGNSSALDAGSEITIYGMN